MILLSLTEEELHLIIETLESQVWDLKQSYDSDYLAEARRLEGLIGRLKLSEELKDMYEIRPKAGSFKNLQAIIKRKLQGLQ